MHLPELPYYIAESYKALGDYLTGRAIIDKYCKAWIDSIGKDDAGFFGTTPFFISYCENAHTSRRAYYSYLLGFAYRYMGRSEESTGYFEESHKCDPSNLCYRLESTM